MPLKSEKKPNMIFKIIIKVAAMYVIVKHLPSEIAICDFKERIEPLIKGGIIRKNGEIKAIKFIELVDKSNRFVELHAIVRVCSEDSRRRLIKGVNSRKFMENIMSDYPGAKPLVAADYVIRHWTNDRRIPIDSVKMKEDSCQRICERRRLLKLFPLQEWVCVPRIGRDRL